MGVSCAFPPNKQKILKNNGLIQISRIDLADVLPAGTKARSCLILWEKECQQEWLPRTPQSTRNAQHHPSHSPSQHGHVLNWGWKPPHVVTWLMSLGRKGKAIYCLVLQPPSPQFYFYLAVWAKDAENPAIENTLLHSLSYEAGGITMVWAVPPGHHTQESLLWVTTGCLSIHILCF